MQIQLNERSANQPAILFNALRDCSVSERAAAYASVGSCGKHGRCPEATAPALIAGKVAVVGTIMVPPGKSAPARDNALPLPGAGKAIKGGRMNDSDGLERYGPVDAWSRELGIPSKTLRERLTGLQGITARLKDGTVVKNGFYSESDVRRLCADMLKKRPNAD
jgi:hypothetical protein